MNYNNYIKNMISEGYKLEKRTITEKDLNVKISSVRKNCTESVVIIKYIPGCIISIRGTDNVSEIDDISKVCKLKLNLYDKNDNELLSDTKIRISKESSGCAYNGGIIQIARLKYEDINIQYNFKQGFVLRSPDVHDYDDHLCIYAITPNIDIDKNKTKLSMELDVLTKVK